MTVKFDKDFEEDVLACALLDTAYLKSASRLLEAHHFHSKQHGWIWSTMKKIWEVHKERATGKLIVAHARRDWPDDEERETVIELARKVIKLRPAAGKATLEELAKFVKFASAQMALEASAKALEKGDVDDAYNELRRCVRKNIDPKAYSHIPWYEGLAERMADRKYRKEHPEEFPRVPTGFDRLDRILSGGLEIAEMGMVLGTTGKGKSICLTNMCYSGVVKGIPSAYFSMEMPASQIGMRHDARWLKIPYRKLKEFDFTKVEIDEISRKRRRFRKKFENMLHIIATPLRQCTLDTIRFALDDLYSDYKFRPRAVYLDSADHMSPITMGAREEYRLRQAAVYWEVADWCGEEGIAVWTSTHAGRDWADKIAEVESAGESYDKARIVDVAFSLNRPKKKTRSSVVTDDDDDGEEVKSRCKGDYMELRLGKYRDGKSLITIPIDADFAMMHMSEIEEDEEEEA